ncbi:MAG: type II secretion system F family protein [Patescibacteria group bacterium]
MLPNLHQGQLIGNIDNMEQQYKKNIQWFSGFTIGLNKERDYFVENLSLLISSGMSIVSALDAIAEESRSRRMKNILAIMREDIESGLPLWKALEASRLFPEHAVSLIRLGEASGNLIQNLKMVVVQQDKERVFRAKIHSAMMYPMFVLSLTVLIGLGTAWFILPKLASVFAQIKLDLPLITRFLISTGTFFGLYGAYVVPISIFVLAVSVYIIFISPKTKFMGQYMLFWFPGINQLIQEIELARFGYLLGTLLEAGLPVTQALGSLATATEFPNYKKLYVHLKRLVEDGNSFQKSFMLFYHAHHLVPAPIQQLIFAGEQSGSLPATLLKIGNTFEAKADVTTKDMTVILEPILLVIVWVGVVGVALAVILPIYNLIGGLNPSSPTPVPLVTEQIISPSPLPQKTPAPQLLRILSTELGYLNVRSQPSVDGDIINRVTPDDTFVYTDEDNGWYQIILPAGNSGWLLGKYIVLVDGE